MSRPRGPKKGHIAALKTRIETLEQSLSSKESPHANTVHTPDDGGEDITEFLRQPALVTLDNQPHHGSNTGSSIDRASECLLGIVSQGHSTTPGSSAASVMSMQWNPAPAEAINDLMRADLDQLYFDRVHAFVPMVHRRRYSSWAKQGAKSDIQVCLQQSMWALAASLSAQYQHMCDLLYMQTRHTLELLDARQDGSESLEANQIQAWLLITMFEFMRTNSQRACVSAGRSFRLIQLARFYEIDLHGSDGPGSSGAQSPDAPAQTTWINVEEQRRTFWCAYILDRLISLRNDCPLTLSEQLIATRVPSSELDFQNGRPSFTGFLSELISSPLAPSQRSIFTELIVWSTVCGRVMTHTQQSIVERIYNNPSQGFWDRHQWLDSVISQRTQIFLLQYPDAAEHEDPLKARSLTAAQEMGKLVKILGHLSCFMVHPFTAVALAGWADFLSGSKDQDPVSEADFQDILSALRELKSVNNLAADYLRVYE